MMRGANGLACRISTSERMKFRSLACLAATLTLMVVAGPNSWSRLLDRAQRLGQHEARDGVDQAELDGEIDEGAGRVNLPLVVAPAHQRLESDHRLAADVHFRLERAAEPAIPDRQAQPLLELHPGGDRPAHVEVEIDRIPLGVALGPVHGAVGVAAQLLVGQAVLRMDAHPDRGRGEHLERLDVERLLQVGQDLRHDRPDLLAVLDRIEQQQELVAADARQHVAAAQPLGDALGDLQEQRVADGVAVVVVDVLEIVQVDEGERKPVLRLAQNEVDALADENAVRQAGQIVEVDAPQQRVLDLPALGDVERAGEQQVRSRMRIG